MYTLICGKIGNFDKDVTILNLSRAYAHLVSTERPAVINLSLSPIDDQLICEHCGEVNRITALHSQILPFIFKLAGNETFTVMAAGNSGQQCNARHAISDIPSLAYAVALGATGKRTKYSSFPEGDAILSDMAVFAFGGDDKTDTDGFGIFENDRESIGTSFAAPYISASAYATIVGNKLHGSDINRSKVFNRIYKKSYKGWYPDGYIFHNNKQEEMFSLFREFISRYV